jgi:hypothetical protein
MGRALVAATVALAAACQGDAFFVCSDDDDCGGAAGGVCEIGGACSFPDDACDSGRRYGQSSAPPLAGRCTEIDEGTSTEMGSTTTITTTTIDPSSDASTSTSDASSSTGTPACPPDWWDCAWGHRVRIDFATRPDEPLASFPVLVLLGPSRVDYTDIQADGEDLRFVSSRGDALPFEMETWDPSGVSTIWVALDELGPSSDPFFLYYDNPVAENAQDPGSVWPAPHVAVFHFTEDTLDVTDNANHASPIDRIALASGQIADGGEIGDTMRRLDLAPSESLADVFVGGGTISAWIRPWGWGSHAEGFARIAHRDPGTGVGFQFYVLVGALAFSHQHEGGNQTWTTLPRSLSLLRWTHVAVVYDAGSGVPAQLYIDGVAQELDDSVVPPTGLAPSDADVPINLGNRPQGDRTFQGRLDEIRIEHTSRSAAWIGIQELVGRDALLVFDAPEVPGGPP